MNIRFYQNEESFRYHKHLAMQKAVPGGRMVPVVTNTKLTPNSRKSFYGFHFEIAGSVKVGDIQYLEDGSVRRIEAICNI